MCFNHFVKFVSSSWGYLVENNLPFWLPYLPSFAESIRNKCLEKGCFFPQHDNPNNGFNVSCFLDDTMNKTCRTAGGPAAPGVNAPRNDPLIQRAFYNGWAKTHGLKWQTCDGPNGMTLHAWGGVSLRHNDLETLRDSNLNNLLAQLQQGQVYIDMFINMNAYIFNCISVCMCMYKCSYIYVYAYSFYIPSTFLLHFRLFLLHSFYTFDYSFYIPSTLSTIPSTVLLHFRLFLLHSFYTFDYSFYIPSTLSIIPSTFLLHFRLFLLHSFYTFDYSFDVL
jgi:hypothetical protein